MTDDAAEIAALRARLAEAEDTLRAIRFGEVDALVVGEAGQDRIFHLGPGNEGYLAFMEAMELGAAALDDQGTLLYANAALSTLLDVPHETLRRDGLLSVLGAAAAETIAPLIVRARGGRHSAQCSIGTADRRRQLLVSAAPLALGFGTGVALTFTDITQRLDAAAAAESERIGSAVMASATEAVVVCGRGGIITHASPAVRDIVARPILGLQFEEAFPLIFAPGAGVLMPEDIVTIALGGSTLRGIEATVGESEAARDVLISAAPLRQAAGAVGGCIVTLVDLTARKTLEKRQALLMRELDHRMKNTLALVLSISTRTLATVTSLEDYRERFTQRVAALAATQNLLAEKSWEAASLADLLAVEIAPFVPARSPRVKMEGLDVPAARDAAMSLGLVFHELVTNAVKYGALSNESGTLSVTGRLDGTALHICWRESGGPPVSPPSRVGFGQTVIARGLGHIAAAPTSVRFEPAGLVCELHIAREVLGRVAA